MFVGAGCGGCHTLAAAGTHGTLGPDFNTSERLDEAQIRLQLRVGGGGMPPFDHRLTPREQEAVAHFVATAMARRRPRLGQ
ncbi:MAG: cytochrome c [Actinobacteria bacterium]|nr:cytochrome c [Actinomycetota bacterium]